MKRDASPPGRRRGWLYAAAVWLLLAGQVQLILAAEFHRHGYPVIPSRQAATVSAATPKAHSPVTSDSACVVCQIVRQGAARAMARGAIMTLSRAVVFHPFLFLPYFFILSTVILPVRAPPSPEWF